MSQNRDPAGRRNSPAGFFALICRKTSRRGSVEAAAYPAEFHTQNPARRCLPCVGGGVTEGDGGGVRLDFVGDYRTMAFTVSIAFTPSVAPDGVTAPPTQGSHFSIPSASAPIYHAQSLRPSGRGMPPPLPCAGGCFLLPPCKGPFPVLYYTQTQRRGPFEQYF